MTNSEHRITNLEKLSLNLGTRIEEAASDTAEEFRVLGQDMKNSFTQIGDTIVKIEESMVTKDDLDAKLIALEERIIEQVNASIEKLQEGLLEVLRNMGKQ